MAGDKDKKKKRSSKKGSKDRAKSRAKPLDAEAFDRAATTLNDATAKLMRAAERHALGDVNHDGAPPDDRAPEPPFNALDLAMHHLFYVSRAVRNATRAA